MLRSLRYTICVNVYHHQWARVPPTPTLCHPAKYRAVFLCVPANQCADCFGEGLKDKWHPFIQKLKEHYFYSRCFWLRCVVPALLLNHVISFIPHLRTKGSFKRVIFYLFLWKPFGIDGSVCVISMALWSPEKAEIKSVQALLYAQFFFLMTRVLLFIFIMSIFFFRMLAEPIL